MTPAGYNSLCLIIINLNLDSWRGSYKSIFFFFFYNSCMGTLCLYLFWQQWVARKKVFQSSTYSPFVTFKLERMKLKITLIKIVCLIGWWCIALSKLYWLMQSWFTEKRIAWGTCYLLLIACYLLSFALLLFYVLLTLKPSYDSGRPNHLYLPSVMESWH